MKPFAQQAGFTLVELVIVIIVLGILASILVPRFYDLRSDAINAAKSTSAGGVRSAFNIAIARYKRFPTVTEVAAQTDGGVAVNNGVQVNIDGTTYTVITYNSTACSTPTSAPGNTVYCIGAIV